MAPTSRLRAPAKPAALVPPLEPGDRLSRADFERRDEATPGDRKFELIDGVVYMASPTKRPHGKTHGALSTCLGIYAWATPGTELCVDTSVRLDEDNEPRPDVLLRLLEAKGGSSTIDADGYVKGAVELAAEVASSTAAYDLHKKKDVYRRHAFLEYLVVVLHTSEVLWFRHERGAYEPLTGDADGVLRSRVFPGLWLDPAALLAEDTKALLATLARGTASPEHAAFVRALEGRG